MTDDEFDPMAADERKDDPLLWEPPEHDPIVDARLGALTEGDSVVAAPYGPCEIKGTGVVTDLEVPDLDGQPAEVTVRWPEGEELHVAIPYEGRFVADALELASPEVAE